MASPGRRWVWRFGYVRMGELEVWLGVVVASGEGRMEKGLEGTKGKGRWRVEERETKARENKGS